MVRKVRACTAYRTAEETVHMMGSRHVLLGVLGTLATVPMIRTDPYGIALYVSTVPGACLLSDLDHHNSTASKTFGPITGIFSHVFSHRKQTHSLFGILVLAIGMSVSIDLHVTATGVTQWI